MATIKALKPEITRDDNDNIYYNIRIYNTDPSSRNTPAVYNVSRVSPIIDNPSDYELAVVRFTIPATSIPIMLWNNWENKLSITLSYDGVDITKVLQYIPNVSPPNTTLYGGEIWSFQEFIDIINVAFNEAFIDLKVAKPLAPPTLAPYLIYNSQTSLFSLLAQQLYDTGNPVSVAPPATIEIYFNEALYQFFSSFKAFGTVNGGPKTYQILVYDTFNNTPSNPVNFYEMKQEYSTLALFNDFTTIIFETDHIPVEPEYEPSVNDTTRRLITDFEPVNDINNRQAFQYFGSGWKRYYDLKSMYPLREIDIKLYWEDKKGEVYPIYLDTGDLLTLKIMFRKKAV